MVESCLPTHSGGVRREVGLAAGSLALLLSVPSAGGALSAPADSPDVGVLLPQASVSDPLRAPLTPVYPPPVTTQSGWGKTSDVSAVPVADADEPVSSVLLAAYQSAVSAVPASCHLPMTLLAAIGQVESGNLAGRSLDADHRAVPPVLGPVLNGKGFSAIHDTDDGVFDGDKTWDRAVGPMQFIPGTWVRFGADLDGDGERNPQDVEDAAGAAAAYLCYGGRDLATSRGLRAAVLSYNHSDSYADLVLAWKATFDRDGFGSLPIPTIVTARSFTPPVVVPSGPATHPTGHRPPPAIGVPTSAPPPEQPGTKEGGDDPLVHPVVDPPAPGPDDPTDPPTTDPTDPPADPPAETPTDPPVDPPAETPTETPADPPAETPTQTPADPPAETPTTAPECEPAADAPVDPETGQPVDDPATKVDETCLPPCAEAAVEDPTVDPEVACEPAIAGP